MPLTFHPGTKIIIPKINTKMLNNALINEDNNAVNGKISNGKITFLHS